MKRTAETSYLKINTAKYEIYKRDAARSLIRFINDNCHIKTAIDAMAGRGIITKYLLRINSLEQLILNDLAKDCYLHLCSTFGKMEKIKTILNQDFFSLNLEKEVDLIVIDFNNFTWNKKKQVQSFSAWLNRNRNFFHYLLYSDSFCYSLKFVKDKTESEKKFQAYLKRIEKSTSMKLINKYLYKNKDCCLILLENEK